MKTYDPEPVFEVEPDAVVIFCGKEARAPTAMDEAAPVLRARHIGTDAGPTPRRGVCSPLRGAFSSSRARAARMARSVVLLLSVALAAHGAVLECPPAAAACCRARVDAPVPDDGVLASSACVRLGRLRGGSDWRGWWYKTLAKFGIFLKKGKLLVLGLDNAGKSTLLTVLMRNEVVPTAPTHQPVTDVIKIGHMKLRAVDMGGHEIARRMWLQYSHEADGIVYIVDAVDRERVSLAR